jgi:hypothetical protein
MCGGCNFGRCDGAFLVPKELFSWEVSRRGPNVGSGPVITETRKVTIRPRGVVPLDARYFLNGPLRYTQRRRWGARSGACGRASWWDVGGGPCVCL